MPSIDGVFWHDGIGFVIDPRWAESHFPDSRRIERIGIGPLLESSGRLPKLGEAPVASWLVARLFQLTGERLGFETHARLYNDGGGIPLHLIAFTPDLQPVAFLYLHGDSTGIDFWGDCAADIAPDQMTNVFVSALLERPHALMRCKLTTIDTDPADLPHRRVGKPYVFGWDGRKFLGQRIDEDQIVAESAGGSAASVAVAAGAPAREPLIEISEALVPSINGLSIAVAPTATELHALLGGPSRILEPLTRAPTGHRSNRLHVYDGFGLIFWQHHYTRRIYNFEIVFCPDEQRMLNDQQPPNRFPGTLRVAGFVFPMDVPDVNVVRANCPAFNTLPRGTLHAARDGFALNLHADGHKLPGGGRTKRLRLVSVSVSWPHDPWSEPASE